MGVVFDWARSIENEGRLKNSCIRSMHYMRVVSNAHVLTRPQHTAACTIIYYGDIILPVFQTECASVHNKSVIIAYEETMSIVIWKLRSFCLTEASTGVACFTPFHSQVSIWFRCTIKDLNSQETWNFHPVKAQSVDPSTKHLVHCVRCARHLDPSTVGFLCIFLLNEITVRKFSSILIRNVRTGFLPFWIKLSTTGCQASGKQ